MPAWRRPQLAALGELIGHWSLADTEPALVSLPTGVGKTAVAMAAPHVLAATRVLVVVPSTELRSQTARQFREQKVLPQVAALRENGRGEPRVLEVRARVQDWESLRADDVVVALPNSISPHHYDKRKLPPRNLFTLVVIDEAHHAPAHTWNEILEHVSGARTLLLTATPRRRDRKQVPGKLILYYPLRKALEEGLFQPVKAVVLEVPGASKTSHDRAISREVAAILSRPEHKTSQLLVRAASIERAAVLAGFYQQLGVDVQVVHSRLKKEERERVLERLRSHSLRGVAVVGMLIEGFDLPSLRVAAYHDKHKSLESTAQLVGRLARVHPSYPQRSAVVTVNDIDTYPQLQGTVRALYEEDPDWGRVLPGIIDDEIEEDRKQVSYARSYTSLSGGVDPAALHPLCRAVVFEVEKGYVPPFVAGQLPPALQEGSKLRTRFTRFSALGPAQDSLILVTGVVERPPWNNSSALDAEAFELHALAFRRSRHTTQPNLLFVNTATKACNIALLEAIGADRKVRPADTGRLQRAFDSLERLSVSSVGVRSTHAARGVPSYRMFVGSGIEAGLRHSDTGHASLGHAMVQVAGEEHAFTAGVSTGKAKWWETRYASLRDYDSFITDLAQRYWYPPEPPVGALLPQVARGRLLTAWPSTVPVAVELNPAVVGLEWEIPDLGTLDRVELHAGARPETATSRVEEEWIGPHGLKLWATYPTTSGDRLLWEGALTLKGTVIAVGKDVVLHRGFAVPRMLSELLTEHPPTVHLLDKESIVGHTLYPRTEAPACNLDALLQAVDWADVDIRSETAVTAERRGRGRSVHEHLEQFLQSRPKTGTHRWILCNDGAGEIADYIYLEVSKQAVFLGLWHAKYAAADSPTVSITDFEQVVSQAIKSRRWITDRRLWEELAARLDGRSHPPLRVVSGPRRKLEILLGMHPRAQQLLLARQSPQVQGEIGIVQPGLSRERVLEELRRDTPSTSALQIQQLLTVFEDSLGPVAKGRVVCSA